ncbi:MAG: hypothetical protein QXS38_00980 [Candidatus Pacearchaeota archaeon]
MLQVKLIYNYISGNSVEDVEKVRDLEKEVNEEIEKLVEKGAYIVDVRHFPFEERGYLTQISYELKSSPQIDEEEQ